jgi:vacuolar-type H+-ATPase subunit H
MSVVAAEQKYREAVAEAREIRDREVSEALETCRRVLDMEAPR